MNQYYQTGDLLYFAGADIPKDAEWKKDGVILHSDRTGHAHRVVGAHAKLMVKDGTSFISTSEGAVLKHEEHKDLFLPPGNYVMRIVREKDHVAGIVREVID